MRRRRTEADEQPRLFVWHLGPSLLYELSLRAGDLCLTGEDPSQPGHPRVAVSPADLYAGKAYVTLDVLQGTVRYNLPGYEARLEAVRVESVERSGKPSVAKKQAPRSQAAGPKSRSNPHGYTLATADEIRAATRTVYVRMKKRPPNLRDVVPLVAKELAKRKRYAPHKAIDPIAAEPEFKEMRRPKGNSNFH